MVPKVLQPKFLGYIMTKHKKLKPYSKIITCKIIVNKRTLYLIPVESFFTKFCVPLSHYSWKCVLLAKQAEFLTNFMSVKGGFGEYVSQCKSAFNLGAYFKGY
jgi:hypothetical protein